MSLEWLEKYRKSTVLSGPTYPADLALIWMGGRGEVVLEGASTGAMGCGLTAYAPESEDVFMWVISLCVDPEWWCWN